MRFVGLALGALALASEVAAAGSAIVLNNSGKAIYVWSVGGTAGPRQTVVSGKC